MSTFADKLLDKVKLTLRQAGKKEFDEEILSYIDTAADDLKDVGILSFYFNADDEHWKLDNKILQAVRWYCLSVFGLYNEDMEKYDKAYRSLKATLATQRKYTDKGYEESDIINIRIMQEQINKNKNDIAELKETVKPIPDEEIGTIFGEDESV